MELSQANELVKRIKKGRNEIEGKGSKISLWELYYNGYDPSFHKYEVYNGTEYAQVIKKSLKMGKRICEDWASLLWSEKLDIACKDKDKLYPLLYSVKFWEKGNKAVEVGYALSLSALAIDLKGLEFDKKGNLDKVKSKNIKIQLSKFNASHIVPITYDDDEITECAFMTENTNTICINAHIIENGSYHILIYRENKETHKSSVYDIDTLSTIPLFAIIQPNIQNNLDVNEDYRPISIFANAIDQIQAIDNKYDAFDSEFVLGRKRVYVSSALNKFVQVDNGDGTFTTLRKRTFDGNDQVIYQLPESNDEKPSVWSPNDPLRSADLISGLQTELQILGNKCGLGNDYYNFEKGRVMTATQVISEKSDTFRNLKKHQLLLENSIIAIVRALIYTNNTFTENEFISDEDLQVIFDDSIIEDKETEKASDRTDVQNGVMSKIEYRMKWYGEDEEEAREKIYKEYGNVDLINRINGLSNALSTGCINARLFVHYVYTDEDIKASGLSEEDLVAYIEEKVKNGESISAEDVMAMGGFNPNQDQIEQNQ